MNAFIVLAATLCVFFSQSQAFRLASIPSRTFGKTRAVAMSVFDKAVGDWAKDYPQVVLLLLLL
jgi:hypothetical protein